jgi:hypothetical protein
VAGPEVFGKYHLIEPIATGGMAEVWRARQQGVAGFEKIVCIKKVLTSLAEDEEFVRLFVDEARIATHLVHVNIVQVFELDRTDDTLFMAMEFVHGLDLARLIAQARSLGPFPVPLALFIAGEVLKALAFAHERAADDGAPMRIVHCDISPQNVLCSLAGEVKLTDFGISRAAFQSKALHKVVRGKYAYMSPEQVDGRPLDRRTDLFSLGIVLYELLTGQRLFKAKTRDQTLDRVRRAEVPSPRGYRPELSEDVESLLLKALQRRPEDRFPDAHAFLEALTRVVLREGHRATHSDLAAFVRAAAAAAEAAAKGEAPVRLEDLAHPTTVVVLAAEAALPPRSIASPRRSAEELLAGWVARVEAEDGQVWERAGGSLLAVWAADAGLERTLDRVVRAALDFQAEAMAGGFRLAAGVCPGVARLRPDTGRPAEGWELAGPFYLARWLMNLSAHRGRVLLTDVAARRSRARAAVLGRIPIQGNHSIQLHELVGPPPGLPLNRVERPPRPH